MVEMSHTTYKSEDGILSEDQLGSPLVDEGNSGGTVGGGVLLKKGPWTSAEDAVLVEYVKKYGEGNWNAVQKHSGLSRCGKSCRLRWANHLRPNLKKGTFTPEEEQLIVELHAKMGNKWARMAAHLPGRTDNEIKNYWNTRVKRRQRASLPLYPPEVCLQVLQEKQQNQNDAGISCGDKRHHDLLQSNSCGGVPAIMFDRSKKANRNLIPYVADLPEISGMNGFVTPHDSAYLPRINSRKHLEESLSFLFGFGRGSRNGLDPLDPMLSNSSEMVACSSGNAFPKAKNLSFEEGNAGSLSLLDGNFSASKPCSVAVKLELPSLQYPRTDLSCWGSSSSTPSFLDPMVDDFIQCSSGIIENGNLSPKNSGLLDALLIESKTLTCARNQSSDKSSNSSAVTAADITNSSALNLCETEWEDYSESISPLGHPVTSMSNECAPMSASGSSIEHPPAAEVLPGYKEKPEAGDCVWTSDGETDTSRSLDIVCRPDALLDSCGWLEQSPFMANEEPVVSDAIQTFLSDALGNDYENLSSDTSASSPGWGLGFCASWNHMPHAVYQMPELP